MSDTVSSISRIKVGDIIRQRRGYHRTFRRYHRKYNMIAQTLASQRCDGCTLFTEVGRLRQLTSATAWGWWGVLSFVPHTSELLFAADSTLQILTEREKNEPECPWSHN
jgi:hypothetical protein